MHRRRLLAGVPALTAFSACGGRLPFAPGERPATTTPTPPTESDASPESAQWVSVKNTRASPTYVTFVVEDVDSSAGGDDADAENREAFVESAELLPGEETRFRAAAVPGTAYDVVIETADGERATDRWRPLPTLDGLATYLTSDGVEFWRHVRCRSDRPECSLSAGGGGTGESDLPLTGDGTSRWYAPAGVVIRNPGAATRRHGIAVSLGEQTLFETRYRIPERAQVSVPLTYRTGDYVIDIAFDGETVTNEWPVPQVPERHVVLGDPVTFGCGPTNTSLALSNHDSVTHVLDVHVRRDERSAFRRRVTLDPRTTRRVVPVGDSGPWEVRAVTETGASTTATWWACPPRGPATVFVDATGAVSLRQGGPRPG